MPITYAFLTSNAKKAAEYRRQLSKYNRSVRILPGSKEESQQLRQIEAYLAAASEKDRFVLRETSDLYEADAWERGVPTISTKEKQGERVYNVSFLQAYTLNAAGTVEKKEYQAAIEGAIDLTKRVQGSDGLWWDDVFVCARSGVSYDQESSLWGKISARQHVIGQFICDRVSFKGMRNWNFEPHKAAEAVDFSPEFSLASLVRTNVFVGSAKLERSPWGLGNALQHVINEGAFFRSARSVRSGNYFSPPISGVPRFPKQDPFHEFVFRLHDIFHQLIADLIFTGRTSLKHRNVYVAARLMSEGLTLVLADMLFVKAIKDSGFDYDYTARKIFPLYEALTLPSGTNMEQLKALLRANVAFANLGDDAPYRAMLVGNTSNALQEYSQKFKYFFIPDLIWSAENYDDMVSRQAEFAAWAEIVGADLFARAKLPLLNDLVAKLSAEGADLSTYQSSVWPVFEHLFENVLRPKLAPVAAVSDERAQSNAFLRYMIGQSFLYGTYRHVKGMPQRGRKMMAELNNTELFTQEEIKRIRGLFRDDLLVLKNKGIITADDFGMYKQVFPLFSPRYLSYEADKALYASVPEAIKAAFPS